MPEKSQANVYLKSSAYLLASFLIVVPFTEALVAIWPLQVSDSSWRFGATGQIAQSLTLPLLGFTLVVWVGLDLGHRRVVKTAAVAGVLAATLGTGLASLFAADALTLRNVVNADLSRAFDLALMTGFLSLSAVTVLFAGVSAGGWMGSRNASRRSRGAPSAPLPTGLQRHGADAMNSNVMLTLSGYGIASYLVLIPLWETLFGVLPVSIGDPAWRFGAAGLLTQAFMTPLLGIVLAAGIAYAQGHRTPLLVVSFMGASIAIGALLLVPVFIVDVPSLRSRFQPEAGAALTVSSSTALLKIAFASTIGGSLAIGGWKAAKNLVAEAGGGPPGIVTRTS